MPSSFHEFPVRTKRKGKEKKIKESKLDRHIPLYVFSGTSGSLFLFDALFPTIASKHYQVSCRLNENNILGDSIIPITFLCRPPSTLPGPLGGRAYCGLRASGGRAYGLFAVIGTGCCAK